MVTRPHSPWLAHTRAEGQAGERRECWKSHMMRGTSDCLFRLLFLCPDISWYIAERWKSLSFCLSRNMSVFKSISGSFPWRPHAHTALGSSTPPPTSAFKSCSSTSSVHFMFDYSTVTKHRTRIGFKYRSEI